MSRGPNPCVNAKSQATFLVKLVHVLRAPALNSLFARGFSFNAVCASLVRVCFASMSRHTQISIVLS